MIHYLLAFLYAQTNIILTNIIRIYSFSGNLPHYASIVVVLVNKVLNDRSVNWTRVSGRNPPK